MGNSNIRLSIAIPTYNGAKYISEALNSIICQLDNINEEIEIVISDNASTDNTKNISLKYCKNYNFIKYFKNSENIGFDRNVDLIFKRASGDFVWLIGDDDEIKYGAIQKVLDLILSKPELSVIFVNVNSESKVRVRSNGDRIFNNSEDFLYNSMFKIGLISCNIIKKNNWNKINSSIYFDSGWIHVGVILEILSLKNATSAVIFDYLLIQGGKKKENSWGGKGTFIFVGLALVDILRQKMPELKYSKKAVNFSISAIKGGYYKYIPLAKAKGLKFNKALFRKFYNCYKNYPSFWFFDLILLIIPNIFYFLTYKIIFRIYKVKLFNKIYKKIKGVCT